MRHANRLALAQFSRELCRSRPDQTEEITMNSFNPNYFIHAANVLLVVAYSVRDILWLRLFAVAASLTSIPYFVLLPPMLWAPVRWRAVFAAITWLPSCTVVVERP